jgi:hypothetical protein
MSQIEVTKVTQFNVVGPPADNISVSKVVMYLLLQPGDSGSDIPQRQAHVYSQKIRRD